MCMYNIWLGLPEAIFKTLSVNIAKRPKLVISICFYKS